jgi:pimeloyl-ACP methyl ester carboxylesterase
MNPTPSCEQTCSLSGVCQQLKDCATPPELIAWPDVLARFEREAVHGVHDTGRYRCRYFSWGSGPPLLFVPGLSERPRAFLLVMSRLVGRFRCLGMELPHGGRDGANLRAYRHEHIAEDVHALLDHLGLPRCYLFGASLGGTVVMRAMHARPERVPRAIVQGSFARGMLRWYEHIGVVFARAMPGRMRHMPLRGPVLRRVHRDHFDARPAEAWRYYLEGNGDVPIRTTAHQAMLVGGVDLRSLLPEIRQPVLLVAGAEDDVVPGRCQEELLAGLPNARLAELPKCGHIPHHTNPEALTDLIGHFLTPPAELVKP